MKDFDWSRDSSLCAAAQLRVEAHYRNIGRRPKRQSDASAFDRFTAALLDGADALETLAWEHGAPFVTWNPETGGYDLLLPTGEG
jgi:hypothetical protein